MIRDCRADLPQGWRYFASNYIPPIRRILSQYPNGSGTPLENILLSLRQPDSKLFQSLDPSPERWFLAQLRQAVLAQLTVPQPEIPLDLETVTGALEPLTVVEKQAAWFETMRYDAAVTGQMMRISPGTVEKIRGRASELIRGKVDAWRRTLLAENGLALGREAAAASGADCLPLKAFLDVLDGRTTWRNRELTEEHANRCWHCLDHFCRTVEVVWLSRSCRPLSDAEAAPYWKILGVGAEKRPAWKRLFGA
jgi:hypothetical protein